MRPRPFKDWDKNRPKNFITDGKIWLSHRKFCCPRCTQPSWGLTLWLDERGSGAGGALGWCREGPGCCAEGCCCTGSVPLPHLAWIASNALVKILSASSAIISYFELKYASKEPEQSGSYRLEQWEQGFCGVTESMISRCDRIDDFAAW